VDVGAAAHLDVAAAAVAAQHVPGLALPYAITNTKRESIQDRKKGPSFYFSV
jgi:hypothetical protein